MRYIVQGKFGVAWRAEKSPEGHFVPDTIDASEFEILERHDTGGFELILNDKSNGRQLGSNITAYDLDGDGLSEIIVPYINAIYRNEGSGRFRRETIADVAPEEATAALMADLDNDAIADLLVATKRVAPRQGLAFFKGLPGGKLSRQPRWIEPENAELSVVSHLTAGDIDRDGDLDLWVMQYEPPYINGQMPTPYFDANDGYPSYLLVNDGKANFSDATDAAGLGPKRHRRTYSGSFIDVNGDRNQDLVVVSDFSGIDLYFGDGKGHFSDVTRDNIDNRINFGMSHAFADFNLDGLMDIFVMGMGSTTARRLEHLGLGRDDFPEYNQMRMEMAYGNRMYLGDGKGRFRQPEFKDTINRSGWSWGVTPIDFDLDGDKDIYIANGHISRTSCLDYCTQYWTQDIYGTSSEVSELRMNVYNNVFKVMKDRGVSWNGFEHNVLYQNQGGRVFSNVSFLFGSASEEDTRNVISDDFDGDGRPDLLIGTINYNNGVTSVQAFRNNLPTDNHWVGVRLREEGQGITPVGAKVTVAANDGGRQQAWFVTGDSLMSQHAPLKHFGLGNADGIEYIEVEWANGRTQRIDNPAIDRYHYVKP
jgi:hypothetical protein